ncbi:MAG: HD domain-containing protein [Candidatus Glassbacteria bacterium]|nr:HD domain-containing protein [Candidatus Glassbacteria bacterium]
MLIHVEDIIPGMLLESAISLKAGSYLLTPQEIPDGLDEKVIESIHRFSSQFSPLPHFVNIVEDDRTLVKLHEILTADIGRVADTIRAGGDFPNFLSDADLGEKVGRVLEKVLSNPDIIREVYQFKNASREGADSKSAFLDHTFRVTLLSVALGVRLHMSVIALINLVAASLMHDIGILQTEIYPRMGELDELNDRQVQEWVDEHARLSAEAFGKAQMTMLPQTKADIRRAIEHHHRIDLATEKKRSLAAVLHLADLVDEMIGPMPHQLRYNFNPVQLREIGRKMAQRAGINRVTLALVKLYRKVPPAWPMVLELAELFGLQELTIENYEQKLKEIFDICPYGMQRPYPQLGGSQVPRMVYCKDREKEHDCEHYGRAQVAIQTPSGKMVQYYKCGTMTNALVELNKEIRPTVE